MSAAEIELSAMDTTSLALEVRALRAELAEVRAKGEGQQAQPVWFARGAPWELLLVVVLCNIYWHDWANAYVDDKLGLRRVELRGSSSTIDPAPLVMLLPLAMLAFWDCRYNASKRLITWIPDLYMNYVLRVAGGYGIVQVLAQDLGLKSGINQRNMIQHPAVQFLMLWGGAFSLTSYRSEGMVSVLFYFALKYNVSSNATSAVCFEDV